MPTPVTHLCFACFACLKPSRPGLKSGPARKIWKAGDGWSKATGVGYYVIQCRRAPPPWARTEQSSYHGKWQGRRSWGWGVLTPLKICRRGQRMFWPPPKMSHSFIQNRLLLYNCKFHSIKDEQLDTITSLILVMLMLPSFLISYKQTVSSNQCLCCYTGLKVIFMCYMLSVVQHKSMVAMKR